MADATATNVTGVPKGFLSEGFDRNDNHRLYLGFRRADNDDRLLVGVVENCDTAGTVLGYAYATEDELNDAIEDVSIHFSIVAALPTIEQAKYASPGSLKDLLPDPDDIGYWIEKGALCDDLNLV